MAAVLLGQALAAPLAARAQQQEADPEVRLVVTEVSGVVGPAVDPPEEGEETETADLDLRVLVENTGEVDVGDLQVVVEVHGSVGGARSLLAQALDDGVPAGPTLELERVDVRDGDELLTGDIAGEAITVDGDGIGWRGSNDVYPVEISVLFGSEVLDRVVTAVVHLSSAEVLDRPLQTTVVWPISAPTARTAAGRYAEPVPDDLAEGGRLDTLLSALEAVPELPVVLAPEVELVEELADRADGFTLTDGRVVPSDAPAATRAARLLDRLRALVEAAPLDPVVGPYGRADVAALASAPSGLADYADRALDLARTRAEQLLGRPPAPDLLLSTTPLTPASTDLLDPDVHLLLPFDQVQGGVTLAEELDIAHATQELVTDDGDTVLAEATIADPRVGRVLADPPVESGPAVVRQRLVAETALLHLTRPGESGRSLLVLPPVQWDPVAGTGTAMLRALDASPWLSLGDLTGVQPRGEAQLASRSATLPGSIVAELTGARAQLEALREAMPDGLPDLDGQTVNDLDDALLRALTPETLGEAGADALARIRAVRNVTDSAFGEVELPDGTGVTLTSDTGEVPVTLQRTRGGDIELLVEVNSPAGLQWGAGGQTRRVTLPEGSSRTVAFSARAAARGTFPVTVSVWDPTQSKLLDTAILSVRSTAISRTALVIIGVVVLVLLALGARRRRSPTLEVVR